ncbi:MAG: DeoR/GlpR family DNA-binding transcription regulator [Bacillota bacterium]|nr:DeoR/GlpR family DNA-binding transcription regulator [Bacillota bacterium]
MEDKAKKPSVFAEERKQQILEILHEKQKIVVPELCDYFGVSASTIRGDLKSLQEANLIKRTHGGAIINTKVNWEPLPSAKETHMHLQKAAIAKTASQLVDDGDIIAICTGTTTLEFAKALLNKKKLTVVVNDIRIASFLEENSDFTLFMVGGIIRRGFHYVITSGYPLPNISIDKVFFSCNSLNAAVGATVPDIQLASSIPQIMKLASEKILLCDSSKVGSVSFAQIVPVSQIDTIIVDSDINPSDLQNLQSIDTCQIIVSSLS